ncbi:MAG: 50S ribosomal protein L10, partial [Nanobdellota archaeon]
LKKESEKKKGVEKLINEMKGMPALIFTEQNPFTLFKELKKNKSTAPAKAGQEAPKDIVIPAGPTPFAPGPIIGELGALGIKSGVESGKVAIKEDSTVAKEGDKISSSLAGILSRLGIQPMEVGLDLRAVYDNGVIYSKDILDVDEEEIKKNAEIFASEAFNLAMNADIIVKETIEPKMVKAVSDARALALELNIFTDDNASDILTKAEMQAKSLDNSIEY